MPKRILHVALQPDGKAPPDDALTEILDRAPDWVKYGPDRWLLWTSASAKTWHERLRKGVGKDDGPLIFSADFNEYSGYLPTSVWDWLRKYVPQEARSENEEV